MVRGAGERFQTLMNAVLKGYVDHQRAGRNRDEEASVAKRL